MNKSEWKEYGYPFDVKRNAQVANRPSRYVRFLTNFAIASGCDIDETQPNRWQWISSFTRALDNIYDGDVDENINPEQIWSTEYKGKQFQYDSGEVVSLDNIREVFERIVYEKRATTNPHELVKKRIDEINLFVPMGRLTTDGVDENVARKRDKFYKGVLLGGVSASLIDDCADIEEDFEAGIHQVSPVWYNKLILARYAVDYGLRGLPMFPPSQLVDIIKLTTAGLTQSLFETSLQAAQNRVQHGGE
ncbi:MAG: hypothetical protein LBK50_02245 [Candidatus Nomurabacteria bacterium]|jgi:hypothetical protein|nr:hypothetical protein [Candidatus Nomurabacteria bacterium]